MGKLYGRKPNSDPHALTLMTYVVISFPFPDSPAVRFFSKVPGGFQKHNKDFPLYLKNFNFIEVSSSDLCDVILNFCPVDSEVGPCIEAILKETRGIAQRCKIEWW